MSHSSFSLTSQSGFSLVEASVPASSLEGAWHSIVLAVGGGVAQFYLDGSVVTVRNLEEGGSLADGSGELTVGGLSSGSHYTGLMQDARIYPNALSER